MRIVLTGNTSFKIANFRAGLIHALLSDGHEIIVLAPEDNHSDVLRDMGCSVISLHMKRNGINPLSEVKLLVFIYYELRRHRPDFVFGYTIKNNIYSGLACRLLRIPFVANVTGLGPAFNHETILNNLIRRLYRIALRDAQAVFFQNTDDRDLFLDSGLLTEDQARLLPGSGVDLKKFTPAPLPSREKPVRFLLVARMLRDKGIEQFVQAARIVLIKHPEVQFQLLGPLDPDSKTGITQFELNNWVAEGVVDYLGSVFDVRACLANAHCVVLPSFYREGTPRTLLEAAAMSRPLITTDMPGCRDVVIPDVSGFLVRPQDSNDLACALLQFLALSPEQRDAMGQAGRQHMETNYDEKIVINAYLELLD